MSVDFHCFKALVAVGMNGDMVILTVSNEAKELRHDAQELPATQALRSDTVPSVPGLYEFNGSTYWEFLENSAPAMLHRGRFELVSAYATS